MTDGILPYRAPLAAPVGAAHTVRARRDATGAAEALQALEVAAAGTENVLPRIFDPFFSTKPTHEGAGLGLSICRDLVRSNGSEIRVASKPGEGTTFTVWLPEAKPEDRREQS